MLDHRLLISQQCVAKELMQQRYDKIMGNDSFYFMLHWLDFTWNIVLHLLLVNLNIRRVLMSWKGVQVKAAKIVRGLEAKYYEECLKFSLNNRGLKGRPDSSLPILEGLS